MSTALLDTVHIVILQLLKYAGQLEDINSRGQS